MVARIAVLLLFPVVFVSVAAGDPYQAAPQQPPAQQRQITPAQILARAAELKDAGLAAKNPVQMQEASELVRAVLERDPNNTEAHLLAAELLLEIAEINPRLADLDGARDHFKLVLDLEPSNFRANFGFGKIYNANRAWRQASAFLQKAEQVAPDTKRMVEVQQALAVAYAGMGNMSLAIEKAAEAARNAPDDLDVLQTLVEIRLSGASRDPRRHMADALADAENYVQKVKAAVEQDRTDKATLIRLNRAYDLLLAGLRDHHTSSYERDVHNQPTDKLLRGHEAEASATLNRTCELLREQALLRLTLADHDILVLAEKAVEYDPRNIAYLENLAAIYQRTHFRDETIETCRKILALDPDHAGARQYLQSVGEPVEPAGEQPAPSETTGAAEAPSAQSD